MIEALPRPVGFRRNRSCDLLPLRRAVGGCPEQWADALFTAYFIGSSLWAECDSCRVVI